MIEEKCRFVLAADANWFVVSLVIGEDLKPMRELWKQPIIAWAISENKVRDGFSYWATPICAESINREYHILSPDGQIISPENASWDSIDRYFDAHVMSPEMPKP